jgi:hypothetical protein
MVKLEKESGEKELLMRDLEDGQMAEVIDSERPEYYGRIVQRYKNICVSLGLPEGNSWTDVQFNTLRVRLLEDGEKIVIFNNK